MPGYEQHDKYLQRIGPDAGGIDERLVDEVVDKLRSLHDGEYDEDEYPHVDVQTHSSAVFEYQAESDTDDIPDERSHIWNDVQDAGYEGDFILEEEEKVLFRIVSIMTGAVASVELDLSAFPKRRSCQTKGHAHQISFRCGIMIIVPMSKQDVFQIFYL